MQNECLDLALFPRICRAFSEALLRLGLHSGMLSVVLLVHQKSVLSSSIITDIELVTDGEADIIERSFPAYAFL